jgi:hypothetical protein
MSKPALRAALLAAWGLVAVPAAFFAILVITDRLGARRYPVPSVVLPWWFWLAVYFVLLGSGALAIISLPMRHGWVRLCLAVAYIAVVGFVLLLLGSLLEVNGYHYSR